jgi:hypothetical protein
MACTEKDARTKWCPFVRYVTGEEDDQAPANRWPDFTNPPPCRCIASDCMMWRWADGTAGWCGLVERS